MRGTSIEDRTLQIELMDRPRNLDSETTDYCTAIFSEGLQATVFASEVLALELDILPRPQLLLRLPENLTRTEARTSSRIPLHRETGLEILLSHDGQHWRPRPLDISLGGILVEFPPDLEVPMSEFDAVRVDILLGDFTTSLEALVQRRQGRAFALYFVDALRELRQGLARVPRVLQPIIESVEREWLERTSHLEL